jgi:DNA polymerase III epsilon subunit-like protein
MTIEIFICVDVETAGAYPARYAMLSIGACLVSDIATTFYVELKPDRDEFQAEALAISGLDLDMLRKTGEEPAAALAAFARWIARVVPEGARPVFVAFNAPFDWMFMNDYFLRYLGVNPFGHSALDIKAYFMGQQGVDWAETSMPHISRHFLEEVRLTHNALRDAQDQADIFRKILKLNPRFNLPE